MVPPGLLRSVLCSTNSEVQYSLEGTVNGAGSAVDWLQDRVALDTARALQTLSRQPGIETPLLMNGVGGLGSPYWQPRFATEFIGTGSEMSQLQAVVESIVFLIRVNLDLMKKAGPLSRIVVTGGFARCNYFCDALAGLSGMAVERYALPEATARGVAFLAAGLPRQWHSVSLERRFTPSPHSGLHARFAKWQQAMHERDAWSP
jgi:glycerol kinase